MLPTATIHPNTKYERADHNPLRPADPPKQENNAEWAIFILIMLLIVAFCTSYTMQQRKITAIHETVVSIFGGALPAPPLEPSVR